MIIGHTKSIEHSNQSTKECDFMNPLYVGINVSNKFDIVYLMLPNGDDHSNFSVANSHDGSTQLVKRILNDSVNQVLSISITSIKTLEAQIKEFNKAIAA